MSNLRRRLMGMSSFVLAAAIWLPAVHLFFQPRLDKFRQTAAVAPRATELASRQLNLWEDPAKRQTEIDRMRSANAEWDFMFGFGYAREWPPSWEGPSDVDSGPVVPVLGVSAGSSGLAFPGAASFGDDRYLRELLTTVNFAAFPIRGDGELRYAAGNQVGDAVLLYALVQGPLWQRMPPAPEKLAK